MKARTLKDIQNHPAVESTHVEWDGCFEDSLGREVQGRWVYLKEGWISPEMECGTIHEPTIKACCELLNNVVPKMEATLVTAGRWAVRPEGQLGTCGFHPVPWQVEYVDAASAAHAVDKVQREWHHK